MSTWIAEDVPWYQVDPSVRRLSMTDEDHAMSAPVRLGEFATEQEARSAVAGRLEDAAHFNHVQRSGQSDMYRTAAYAILLGVDGVRIKGRYHLVRKV